MSISLKNIDLLKVLLIPSIMIITYGEGRTLRIKDFFSFSHLGEQVLENLVFSKLLMRLM